MKKSIALSIFFFSFGSAFAKIDIKSLNNQAVFNTAVNELRNPATKNLFVLEHLFPKIFSSQVEESGIPFYNENGSRLVVLSTDTVSVYNTENGKLEKIEMQVGQGKTYEKPNKFTSFAWGGKDLDQLVVGTDQGELYVFWIGKEKDRPFFYFSRKIELSEKNQEVKNLVLKDDTAYFSTSKLDNTKTKVFIRKIDLNRAFKGTIAQGEALPVDSVIWTQVGDQGGIQAMVGLSDGFLISFPEAKAKKVNLDGDSKDVELSIKSGYVNKFVVSPDKKKVLALADSGYGSITQILIIDSANLNNQKLIQQTVKETAAWSPDSKLFALASERDIYFYDTNENKLVGTKNFALDKKIKEIAWHPKNLYNISFTFSPESFSSDAKDSLYMWNIPATVTAEQILLGAYLQETNAEQIPSFLMKIYNAVTQFKDMFPVTQTSEQASISLNDALNDLAQAFKSLAAVFNK